MVVKISPAEPSLAAEPAGGTESVTDGGGAMRVLVTLRQELKEEENWTRGRRSQTLDSRVF